MNGSEMELKEVQQCALEILKAVTDLCDKLNVRYYLAYGTLIGAVRHEGFIPWDDDIDIMMPRPDYDRFISYLKDNPEAIKPYYPINIETTPNYPHNQTRIYDSNTVLDVFDEKDCGLGVFIDIIVLEGLGNDYNQAIKIMRKARYLSSSIFQAARTNFHYGLTKGFFRRMVKPLFYAYTHLLGKRYFMKESYALYKNLDYNNSTYVGSVRWCTYAPYKETFLIKHFDGTKKCKFEGYLFSIPEGYDDVLRQLYGNYMKLPPVEDRIAHHLYKAYKK